VNITVQLQGRVTAVNITVQLQGRVTAVKIYVQMPGWETGVQNSTQPALINAVLHSQSQ
jgi:hypothetical protein